MTPHDTATSALAHVAGQCEPVIRLEVRVDEHERRLNDIGHKIDKLAEASANLWKTAVVLLITIVVGPLFAALFNHVAALLRK